MGNIPEARNGDFIQLCSGRAFYPLDPRPHEISRNDIASALSKLCRWAGHCKKFMSIAEHSVLVWLVLRRQGADLPTQRAGLLHDGTEGLGFLDLARPIKKSFPDYVDYENNLLRVLGGRYNFPYPLPQIVKEIDNRVLVDEFEQNMTPPVGWTPGPWAYLKPTGVRLHCWTPDEAYNEFLAAADQCGVLD